MNLDLCVSRMLRSKACSRVLQAPGSCPCSQRCSKCSSVRTISASSFSAVSVVACRPEDDACAASAPAARSWTQPPYLHCCACNTRKDSPAQQEDSQAPAPIPLHDTDHINRRTRLLTSRRLVAIAYTALHRVQAQLLGAQRFMRGRFACYVTR